MPFVYEELTEDRKKDFPELDGRYPKGWYIDHERNICIWGGLAAGHWMPIAEGDYRWKFNLGINHDWANSNMRCDSFKSHMIINKLSKFL